MCPNGSQTVEPPIDKSKDICTIQAVHAAAVGSLERGGRLQVGLDSILKCGDHLHRVVISARASRFAKWKIVWTHQDPLSCWLVV